MQNFSVLDPSGLAISKERSVRRPPYEKYSVVSVTGTFCRIPSWEASCQRMMDKKGDRTATCQISPCKRPASTSDVFLPAAQH